MIYFVRHGQTQWNAEHRLQSHSDIPLNEVGRTQAEQIATLFAKRQLCFGEAATSALQRAAETASIILDNSTAPNHTLHARAYVELVEVSLGDYEGLLEADLRIQLGSKYDAWRQTLFATPAPNGESRTAAGQRVRPILHALKQSAAHSDVLVVGHQAINMVMKAELSRRSDIELLRTYMQANNEVDVWDVTRGSIIERVRV